MTISGVLILAVVCALGGFAIYYLDSFGDKSGVPSNVADWRSQYEALEKRVTDLEFEAQKDLIRASLTENSKPRIWSFQKEALQPGGGNTNLPRSTTKVLEEVLKGFDQNQ